MRDERLIAVRHEVPLVVRGSLPRTFRSLGVFVEATLLLCGTYLLLMVLWKPLEVDQGAILGAGVTLGLAAILLFYLFRPRWKEALSQRDDRSHPEIRMESTLTAYGESLRARHEAERILENEEQLPGPM
jgi:hypothetical protein